MESVQPGKAILMQTLLKVHSVFLSGVCPLQHTSASEVRLADGLKHRVLASIG